MEQSLAIHSKLNRPMEKSVLNTVRGIHKKLKWSFLLFTDALIYPANVLEGMGNEAFVK